VFFGFSGQQVPKNTLLGEVGIRYGEHYSTRHMRFGNNSMDKLDLPIPNVDGPPSYSNRTLLFERLPDGSFELTIGTDATRARWQELSAEQGTQYAMQGGRAYGVFTT
jgi:hypothetical protein